MTSLDDATAQLIEFGLQVDAPIADGRVHRVNYGSERKRSGWYVLHQVGALFGGSYGCWKVREEGFTISRRVGIGPEKAQIMAYKEKMRKMALKENEERKERQRLAAIRADEIWGKASPVGSSPYLIRKKISSCGARFHGATLIIPMGKEGRLCSIQSIAPDGFKKFLPGGDVHGCFYVIEGNDTVCMTEGFATGASIHDATGASVVVCFSASNLPKVAPYLRRKKVIVCADHDEAGIRYGKKAAEELGCKIVYPNEVGTDFNDSTKTEIKEKCLN